MKMHHKILVFVFLFYIGYVQSESTRVTKTIGIIHYNDLFGQLQRFKTGSKPPIACGATEQRCSGGFAEFYAHIKKIREDFDALGTHSTLTFSAGNMISGENGWIRLVNNTYNGGNGWKQYGELLAKEGFLNANQVRPNSTALGPREFDGGLQLLNDYIEAMNVHPIVSNLDNTSSSEQERLFLNKVVNYDIHNVNSLRIGVVGFVDTIVVHQSEPENLAFRNTISSLKETIAKLRAPEVNVKTIFAIGTGSLSSAKSIIDEIPEIKLVIYGGGKNSDISDTEYPLSYKTGHIVTAHKYVESIGKLVLEVDETDGDIVHIQGSRVRNDFTNPIEVDSTVSRSVERFEENVNSNDNKGNEVLGKTKIKLEASVSSCWAKECPLGDLVTDAMVHCALRREGLDFPVELISLWHSSGISGGIMLPESDIKRIDVHRWMAYNNMATVVSMKGSILKQMFNASAQTLIESPAAPKWGQFLQVSSGVEVTYNYDIENNKVEPSVRIAELSNDEQFTFQDIQDSKVYWVIMPSFLYNGRNVYHFLPEKFETIGRSNGDKYDIGVLYYMDYKCLENYIKGLGVVTLGHQERIFFQGRPSDSTTEGPKPSSSTSTQPSISSTTEHGNFWESMDSFSKAEVIITSVGVTLIVIIVLIGVVVLVLIKTNRRPMILHKRMRDSFSST